MAWPNKYKQPQPERFAAPLFIEKPMSEDDLRTMYVKHVLFECDGNKSLAARVLKIDRRSLYRRLEKLPPGDV